MKLRDINALLRRIGLVLVVAVDDDGGPTEFWIERASRYDSRVQFEKR